MNTLANRFKKVIIGGVSIYTLNTLMLPLSTLVDKNVDFFNPIIYKHIAINNYLSDEEANRFTSYQFLKLANLVAIRGFRVKHPDDKHDLESIFSKQEADCFNVTQFTYSTYIRLVEHVGKKELVDKVRAAYGSKLFHGIKRGHAWLEFKGRKEWIPFEATAFLEEKIDISTAMKTWNWTDTVQFFLDPDRYFPYAFATADSNHKVSHSIEWINALKDYQGIIGLYLRRE